MVSVAQTYPVNIGPFGAGYPAPAALRDLSIERFVALGGAVEGFALFDADTISLALIRLQVELLAGPNLWTDILGETHQRNIFRNAYFLNRYRGTKAVLDRFAGLVGVGYYYQVWDVNGNRVGTAAQDSPPNTITFHIVNHLGLGFTPAVQGYLRDGFKALLPRLLDINPFEFADLGELTPAVAFSGRQLGYQRDSQANRPGTAGSFDGSFDQSFERYIP